MPFRATADGHFRLEQRETKERRAIPAGFAPKKTFVSSRLGETPHELREQINRENNRTITGAYQGDIRRKNRRGRPPRRSQVGLRRYAMGAWLRGRAAAILIQNGATIAARP
jgi:hypothetical protein